MFEIYDDRAKRWRWRFRAKNGNILCDSGQGYASKDGVSRAVWGFVYRVRSNAFKAMVKEVRK